MTPPPGGGREQAAQLVVLELAVDAAGIGTFDWDLRSGALHWDERLLDLFGFDHSSFERPIEEFIARLHLDDQQRVRALIDGAIAACGDYQAEYRVLLPTGDVRWIAARGRVLADADGAPERLVGAALDLTERRQAEARISRAMDSMATAFFALDRDWCFSYVNAEASRVLGRPREQLLGGVVWELFPAAVGSEFEANYRRAAYTGEPVAFDAYYPEPLNAWYEVRAWPSADGLAVYFLEVTDRRRAEEQARRAIGRAALLGEVTGELAGSLDPEQAMLTLCRLVSPALSDWSIATLIDDDRPAGIRAGLGSAVAWHTEPGRRELLQRYAEERLAELTDDAIVVRAVESGEDQLLASEASVAVRAMLRPGSPAAAMIEELHPDAIAVLPLRGREQPVGMLTLANGPERGGFGDEDLALAREIAARAGLVLDRARLYRRQREVAEGLQRSLLSAPAQPEGLQVAVRYVPAAEATQVGGDWYDAFLQRDGALVVVIGDVTGHALHAAAAMGQVRTLVRGIAAHSGATPAQVLADVEEVMDTLELATTATAVVGRLEGLAGPEGAAGARGAVAGDAEPFRFVWSNAGHPPPMLLHADGAVSVLGDATGDLLLGALPGAPRRQHGVAVPHGSTLVLYTDGLVERRDEGIDAGVARLEKLLRRLAGLGAEEICEEMLAELLPATPDDDVALMAVRVSAPARRSP